MIVVAVAVCILVACGVFVGRTLLRDASTNAHFAVRWEGVQFIDAGPDGGSVSTDPVEATAPLASVRRLSA